MSTTRVLNDTGPIVALLHRGDPHHAACDNVATSLRLPLLTCWPVITEAAYLLRRSPDTVRTLLRYCNGQMFEPLSVAGPDLPAIESILESYGDQHFDLADAVLMHLANREQIESIFTLDRRHFSVFRGARGRPLTILPDAT